QLARLVTVDKAAVIDREAGVAVTIPLPAVVDLHGQRSLVDQLTEWVGVVIAAKEVRRSTVRRIDCRDGVAACSQSRNGQCPGGIVTTGRPGLTSAQSVAVVEEYDRSPGHACRGTGRADRGREGDRLTVDRP